MGSTFALISHAAVLRCWKIPSAHSRREEAAEAYFPTTKVLSVCCSAEKCAFLSLFFLLLLLFNVPSITTSAGWERRVLFFFFFYFLPLFVLPVCRVTSPSWNKRGRKKRCSEKGGGVETKIQRGSEAARPSTLSQSLLAQTHTHSLRYATKHNREWFKQTQGKLIFWARYSSWLSCFPSRPPHVIFFPSDFHPLRLNVPLSGYFSSIFLPWGN